MTAKSVSTHAWRARLLAGVAVAPAVIWLAASLLLPLGMLWVFSFWKSTLSGMVPTWTLENYIRFFSTPIYITLFFKSLKTAVLVTGLLLMAGYPVAYTLARFGGRYRTTLLLLLLVPFWTSYLIRSFAWLPLLGKQGLLNAVLMRLGVLGEPSGAFLYNDFAVHVGLAYIFLPFMIIPIYLVLERLDPSLEEAAADQGASPIQTFWRVTLPLSLPGVSAGCILVFMNVLGAYVTPKLLGGPSGIMYGNAVADQFSAVFNLPFGATLAFILVASVLLFIALISALTRTGWADVSNPR